MKTAIKNILVSVCIFLVMFYWLSYEKLYSVPIANINRTADKADLFNISKLYNITDLPNNMYMKESTKADPDDISTNAIYVEHQQISEEGGIEHLTFWTNKSAYNNSECISDQRITSCQNSKLQLLNIDNDTRIVHIGINVYNDFNKRKLYGGDVILVWAKRLPSGGNAPGHVTDHMNGTYSGHIYIPWSGPTKIFVKLVSATENRCLRFKAMKKYGNSVFALKTPYGIHYSFTKGSQTTSTRCYPHPSIYGYKEVCNFTKLNFGFSWFCGKPVTKGIDCNNYNKFRMKSYDITRIVPKQPKEELIRVVGHCEFKQSIYLHLDHMERQKQTNNMLCSKLPKNSTWTRDIPSGYALDGVWHAVNCLNSEKVIKSKYASCLEGKHVFFIGDSTLRQYLEYFAHALGLHVAVDPFSKIAHSYKQDILLSWRKHEMPFHNMQSYKPGAVKSTVFQIDRIVKDASTDDSSIIVVLHYGSHLQAFPPSVYRSRIQNLVIALKRLIAIKPGVIIMVKGAAPIIQDTHWFDVRISLIFNQILFQEFDTLKDHVVYLDVFSIFTAQNYYILHPQGPTMSSQIQQFMSYIC